MPGRRNVATMAVSGYLGDMEMTSVGVRELRNHLSRYLEAVKRGEEIVVTERGRVVAHISPKGVPQDALLRRLAPLIAVGTVRVGRPRSVLRPHRPVKAKGRPGSRMLLEDRR